MEEKELIKCFLVTRTEEVFCALFEAVCVRLRRYFLLRGLTVTTAGVYRLRAGPQPYELFDLVLTQQCATPSLLVLPEYHYGGMGFRGYRDLV